MSSNNNDKVDISRALKAAITTGKVEFGVDQTEKAIKTGKAQMVILSRNCPSKVLTGDINVKVHIYEGNNMELGALCGKPFSVSALAVIDKGTSNILTL
jgi:large subunit ribosomal protein L30e